jgi:hypothetical protein
MHYRKILYGVGWMTVNWNPGMMASEPSLVTDTQRTSHYPQGRWENWGTVLNSIHT